MTVRTGGCLCGAVRYEATGALRDVVVCHCRCAARRTATSAPTRRSARDALRLVEARGLKWYRSSAQARRGFCSECGATLFWEGDGRDTMSIAAGTLDEPTGLATALQIHVASAGDYYAVDASTPIRPE
jgi:hypothetical protein